MRRILLPVILLFAVFVCAEEFKYPNTTGDITGVTAGTGLTGGGTSGAVTLNLNTGVNVASSTYATSAGSLGGIAAATHEKRQFTITLDGAGSVLTTGDKNIGLRIPYDMTLTGWEIKSFPTASTATVKVGISKATFTNWPTVSSIVGSSTPTMTSAIKSSGTCSGWTTSLTAGDTLEFNVLAGVAVSTRAVVNLYGTVR